MNLEIQKNEQPVPTPTSKLTFLAKCNLVVGCILIGATLMFALNKVNTKSETAAIRDIYFRGVVDGALFVTANLQLMNTATGAVYYVSTSNLKPWISQNTTPIYFHGQPINYWPTNK